VATASSDVYPDIERWRLPRVALVDTISAVSPTGRRGRETGVFWLGERASTATVTAMVMPSGEGVEEWAGQWRVSSSVFGVISRWARKRELTLLAIVHIHLPGVPPRLSWADRNLSVQVPGILSVVIGNGGADREHTQWGWYVYENGQYRRMALEELRGRLVLESLGQTSTWCADIHGVREATYDPT